MSVDFLRQMSAPHEIVDQGGEDHHAQSGQERKKVAAGQGDGDRKGHSTGNDQKQRQQNVSMSCITNLIYV